jgi:hypothetical protein
LSAFQEGNSCLLSPGAPDSPVHHRTLSGADFFPYLAKPTVGALVPLAHRTLSGAHRTVRCTTGHCPVRISFLLWRSRPLALWSRGRTGQFGAPFRPLARPCVSRGSRSRLLARPTVGSPDSPVNYSRMPLITSREQQVRLSQPGALDTVRCTTGQSGAPRQS